MILRIFVTTFVTMKLINVKKVFVIKNMTTINKNSMSYGWYFKVSIYENSPPQGKKMEGVYFIECNLFFQFNSTL